MLARMNMEEITEDTSAEKHRNQQRRHPRQCGGRIFGFGLLKSLNPIRYCLDAGQCSAAVGKRTQQQEQMQRLRVIALSDFQIDVVGHHSQRWVQIEADQPIRNQKQKTYYESVARGRE